MGSNIIKNTTAKTNRLKVQGTDKIRELWVINTHERRNKMIPYSFGITRSGGTR